MADATQTPQRELELRMSTFLYRLGKFSVRNRRLVLIGWLLAFVAIAVGSVAAGGETSDEFTIPGTESQQAFDLLDERFPSQSGTSGQIVFATEDGSQLIDSQDAVADTLAEAAELDGVIFVSDPFTSGAVSQDGTIGYATVRYDLETPEVGIEGVEHLIETGAIGESQGLQVEFGGEVVSGNPEQHPPTSEIIGLGVAVVVLLFAFGSVLAMGLPLVTALLGLGIGLTGITLMSAFMDLSSTAPTLATMIGLAVGIDYALFIVTRHRQGLTEGLSVEEAAARANATAGSAVVFAGGTVVIAISGLAVVGIPFLTVMGFATAAVVMIAVLVAVSLLPALLGFCGTKIDRWKAPFTKTRTSEVDHATFGARWARKVTARPGLWLTGALAFMLLLAAPMLDMRLGMPDAGTRPEDTTEHQAYDLLAEGFGPGFNGPLTVVVDAAGSDDPQAVVATYSDAIAATDGVVAVTPPSFNEAGDTAVLSAIPSTGPADAATEDLVDGLRSDVFPEIAESTDTSIALTGSTAAMIDVSQKMSDALPTFMLVVLGLTFLLLLVAFRSLLVPLKASLAILLSIVSSFGVVVAVFQWGWMQELIGLDTTVPIISFMPIMLFAILFGLSMDYEVFIMSRIREEYSKTGDPKESVIAGLTSSARVITAAALIMISVFGAFVLGDDPIIKMFGVGLAVAVFLDATIVRMIIVPAAMTLLDKAAWWLPGWLDRIVPNVDIEGERLMHQLEADAAADETGDDDEPTEDREPALV
ncbi:MMPL family transporter [Ilumatobacter fluminis]|uniref:MMPL family transporter n=1 Tax=Ilumatobacter fluminis TaxID=467091 RepID=UPI0032EF82A8